MNLHVRVFTIGALAKAAGVSTPTIRYYEEIGLLPPAARTTGGQRSYDDADLGRLTFIRQCRDFGFGIDQVRVLLDLSRSSPWTGRVSHGCSALSAPAAAAGRTS